jgi:hypothetical protein
MIDVTTQGRMYRHGWSEEGRRVGEYGQGYQWGACYGGGDRPLEQTDADAIEHLRGLRLEALRARRVETHHRTVGGESYRTQIHLPRRADPKRLSAETGCIIKATQGRDRTEHYVTVPRGFEGLRYPRIPSYDTLRAKAAEESGKAAEQLERLAEQLTAAIKIHRETPSAGVASAKKGPVVHLSVQSSKWGDGTPRCRVWSLRRPNGKVTEAEGHVTCKQCRKAMDKE